MKILTILLLTIAFCSNAQDKLTEKQKETLAIAKAARERVTPSADTIKLTPLALEAIKAFENRGEALKKEQEQLAKDTQQWLATYCDAAGRTLTESDSLTLAPNKFVLHKRKKK